MAFHREHDQLRDHRDPARRHNKTPDHEKNLNPVFNPTFPSLQNVSEDSTRPNHLNDSPTLPYHHGRDVPSDEALHKLKTANSVTMSPELFEKIYLNPQNAVKGELRNTFANPTPLALLGFLLSLSPLSCELMGWRGAGEAGIATVGAYYFIGGFLMSLGGILEFFLGNTFSFVVFCSFGGFWFTLGATLTPAFNAYGAYATEPGNAASGLTSPAFHASFGRRISSYISTVIYSLLCCRLLPFIHGPPEPYLPRLCFANESRLCRHLPRTATNLCRTSRFLLATGGGKLRDGTEIAGCSRRFWVYGHDGGLVDLFCADARFGRLPLSDSSGRYQPFDHSPERTCEAKGALLSIIISFVKIVTVAQF